MSDDRHIPLLEHDDSKPAVIEPSEVLRPLDDMPEHGVLCFFQKVIDDTCADGKAEVVTHLVSEMGRNPVYALDVQDADGQPRKIAVAHPGVGAPLSAGFLEELIAMGCRKFIACGGAGVLHPDLDAGHVVVPSSAIRDEGTSYHYLPPSREVAADPGVIEAIETTLKGHKVPYLVGKTWTTDGIYRETRARVDRRRDEGCVTVEMETAAFLAVAHFRKVAFGQLLYGGDDLSGELWDHRNWQNNTSAREKLFWLAAESVLRL